MPDYSISIYLRVDMILKKNMYIFDMIILYNSNTMIKWIVAFIIIAVSVFINGTPFIFGDGYGYYHSAKTLTTEGTFTTKEEPEYFEYSGHAVFQDKEDDYSTIYPAGNALFWIPGLTISKMFNNSLPTNDYYSIFNGHTIYDGIAILATATILTFASIVLIFKVLRRLGFSERNAFVSIFAVYVSQYIFAYLYYYPSYSHIYELFSASLLIYLFQRTVLHDGRVYEFLFGFTIGLLTLTRVVDIVVAVPFILYLLLNRRFKTVLFTFLGGIPTALIFLYYNSIVYGSPFSLGYTSDRGGVLSFENFNLFNLLFSDVRGLFIWSPLILISIAGLIYGAKKNKEVYIPSIASVVLVFGIYTFWPNWWGGDSIGQRFFIVLAPIFILGTSSALQYINSRNQKVLRILGLMVFVLAVTYAFKVQVLYRVTPVKELHTEAIDLGEFSIPIEERYTPFDIFKYHLDAIKEDGISIDYAKTIFNSFNGGRSLLLLSLGQTDPLVKAEARGSSLRVLVASNTNGILPSDMRIEFSYLDKFYSVTNLTPGEFDILCSLDECTSPTLVVNLDTKDSDGYTFVSENFDIDVESASRINLINRKIKY
jgi:hypothetical protein